MPTETSSKWAPLGREHRGLGGCCGLVPLSPLCPPLTSGAGHCRGAAGAAAPPDASAGTAPAQPGHCCPPRSCCPRSRPPLPAAPPALPVGARTGGAQRGQTPQHCSSKGTAGHWAGRDRPNGDSPHPPGWLFPGPGYEHAVGWGNSGTGETGRGLRGVAVGRTAPVLGTLLSTHRSVVHHHHQLHKALLCRCPLILGTERGQSADTGTLCGVRPLGDLPSVTTGALSPLPQGGGPACSSVAPAGPEGGMPRVALGGCWCPAPVYSSWCLTA